MKTKQIQYVTKNLNIPNHCKPHTPDHSSLWVISLNGPRGVSWPRPQVFPCVPEFQVFKMRVWSFDWNMKGQSRGTPTSSKHRLTKFIKHQHNQVVSHKSGWMLTLRTHKPIFSQPPPAVAFFFLTMLVFRKRIAVIDTLAAGFRELQNDEGMPSQWSHPLCKSIKGNGCWFGFKYWVKQPTAFP